MGMGEEEEADPAPLICCGPACRVVRGEHLGTTVKVGCSHSALGAAHGRQPAAPGAG